MSSCFFCHKEYNITAPVQYSKMRLSRQFQACLLIFFFYEKISRAQKHLQANINQKNKIKQTLNN